MAVGIDEPALAIHLLGAEETGRLQLRTAGPAAEAVGVRNRPRRVRREPRRLGVARGGEVGVIVDLARPVVVGELAVAIDERQERRGRQDLLFHAVAGRDDAAHGESARFAVLPEEDVEGADAPQVEGRAVARRLREAAHAVQFQRGVERPRHVPEMDAQFAGRMRSERDAAAGGLSLHALDGALDAELHRLGAVGRVADGDHDAPEGREIEFPRGKVQSDARIGERAAGAHLRRAVRRHGENGIGLGAQFRVGRRPQDDVRRRRKRGGNHGRGECGGGCHGGPDRQGRRHGPESLFFHGLLVFCRGTRSSTRPSSESSISVRASRSRKSRRRPTMPPMPNQKVLTSPTTPGTTKFTNTK